MNRIRFRGFVFALCVGAGLILAASKMVAQMTTGTILGTVTDPSGGVIPGAKVTITNRGTGIVSNAVTDGSGNYVMLDLIPGTYDVSGEKEGFGKVAKSGITLQVDQKARVDVTLPVGSTTQTVNVESQAPLVQTSSSEQGQVVTGHTIENMPLVSRDFAQLVDLNTGAVPNYQPTAIEGGAVSVNNIEGFSASDVNGMDNQAQSWTVDGVTDNEVVFGNLGVVPAVDAIQEFKITNDSYSAEFGGLGGANVQIAIKSGTNHFHGDAWEFLRNSALDANDFFSNASGIPIPPYRQNQFGGTIGGPIKKNRTFFFTDYEGFRSYEGFTGLQTIPDVAQRIGDFSAPGNPTIYNPLNSVTGAPTPFTGNMIPSNLISSQAAGLMALFPAPNIVAPVGDANYIGSAAQTRGVNQFDVRIDHQLTDKDQFLARYSYFRGTFSNTPFLGTVLEGQGPSGQFVGASYTLDQNLAIAETHTFSPSTLNEARFGWLWVFVHFYSFDQNLQTANQLGIPGVNICKPLCSGIPLFVVSGFSDTASGGYSGFGHQDYDPTYRTDNVFQFVDNLTHIHGKHILKFGTDIRQVRGDMLQTNDGVGAFSFNQNNTSNQGATGTGSGLASLLLGYPYNITRGLQYVFPDSRQIQYAFYAQDDWRATNRLTLNLGLRYDLNTAWRDAHNSTLNFDYTTGNIVLGCIAVSCSGGMKADPDNFGPRLGFAYSLDSSKKTVLRGGFGIAYWADGGGGGGRGSMLMGLGNYPYAVPQSINSANIYQVYPATDPSLMTGIPLPPPPQNRPGSPPGNLWVPANLSIGATVWPHNTQNTQTMTWDLDLQRAITPNLILDASYVGNVGTYEQDEGNSIEDFPEPGVDNIGPNGQPLSIQQRRPLYAIDPGLVGVYEANWDARSDYHALQVKLEKRTSKGLTFLVAYTNSKDLVAGYFYNNPDCRMCQYSPATFDIPQRLVVSYVWELPFGRGKSFGKGWNRWTDAALGGWQWTGITSYESGFPYTPSITSPLDNGNPDQPNRVCNGTLSHPTIQEWYNWNCFTSPNTNQFGNSGFDILRQGGFRDWDMGIMKNFNFTESKRLQFRAEFFNVFNQINWGAPNSFQCGGFCGEGTVTNLAVGYNPRLIQFALKFYY